MATETLKISDGTTMAPRHYSFAPCKYAKLASGLCCSVANVFLDLHCQEICRLPDVDDQTWAEVRAYVEGNPALRPHSSIRKLCTTDTWGSFATCIPARYPRVLMSGHCKVVTELRQESRCHEGLAADAGLS